MIKITLFLDVNLYLLRSVKLDMTNEMNLKYARFILQAQKAMV